MTYRIHAFCLAAFVLSAQIGTAQDITLVEDIVKLQQENKRLIADMQSLKDEISALKASNEAQAKSIESLRNDLAAFAARPAQTPAPTLENQAPSPTPQPTGASTGAQSATIGDFVWSVQSVECLGSVLKPRIAGGMFETKTGNGSQFWKISCTVLNNGLEDARFMGVPRLKDQKGRIFSRIDGTPAYVENSSSLEKARPGIPFSYEEIYEMPDDSTPTAFLAVNITELFSKDRVEIHLK